jgi:SpoIID/LytB domain protein
MLRSVLVFTAVLLVATSAPTAQAQLITDTTPVVIKGHGAAHGFGLAMDGVEGQARAGWDHDKILSLFYPGTENSTKSGTIRVGLGDGGGQRLTLPSGGEISDRPFRSGAGDGYPIRIDPGGAVEIGESGGGLTLRTTGAASEARAAGGSERGSRYAQIGQQEEPLITPLPSLAPTPTPVPKKQPAAEDPTPRPAPPKVSSFWIRGSGNPALVGVEATGRRYRGVMEVRRIGGGSTRVVNHVDLETYVAGIAEEKGQGWPLEGLKVLAVAARTLGAATMTWHAKQHDKGYDICPSSNCQVYLGYDGEEPALRRAVAETAGKIRTYNGRALMAMYHGNGGGQTETYSRVTEGRGQPHPYLKSVKYPHADPSTWEKRTTMSEIAGALRAQGVDVPHPLQLVAVAERGDSPRVLRLRVAGGRDDQTIVKGATFKTAMGLRSTWFDIEIPREVVPAVLGGSFATVGEPARLPPRRSAAATSSGFPWLPTGAASAATLLVAAAALLVAQGAGAKSVAESNRRPRLALRRRRSSFWQGP